jgi:serine phosphatase RsbU (regulator of sigma subunit)
VLWPDGSVHWLHGAGQTTVDTDGNVTGTIGCTRDITDQVLAEHERERLTEDAVAAAEEERINRERLELLTSMNDALSASLTRHDLMLNVTKAAVPRLGDWCSIYVLAQPASTVPEIETAHVDPAMVEYARELQRRFPYDPDAPTGIARVIRTGQTEFYPAIDDALIDALDAPAEAREIVRELTLRSAIAVPLVKRGRTMGAMQFVMTSSRRQYTHDDVRLTEAVAARIAASLDNLRLADEQRQIAATLQASLLPSALPAIPGVDVAVRYWANGEGVDVGGDFYDVFNVDDSTWSIVIGDVCGTGPAAAAVTGLARHTIAAAAWHGDDHETVLRNLNRTMLARETGSFCTAVYGTVTQKVAGSATLTFASGGHPLPVIASVHGEARTAGNPGSLIGVFDELDVHATTEVLRPGEFVVLYTDGATDVRAPYELSASQFAAMVGRAAAGAPSAEAVADRLHEQLSAILPIEQRDDDIALLVLRVVAPPES